MGKKKLYQQIVVADESDLPQGCCHINHFGKVDSWEYKTLSRAGIDGEIESWKKGRTVSELKFGPVFVRRDQAAQYLDSKRRVLASRMDDCRSTASALEECPAFIRMAKDVSEILSFQASFRQQVDAVLIQVQRLNSAFGVTTTSTKEG